MPLKRLKRKRIVHDMDSAKCNTLEVGYRFVKIDACRTNNEMFE
jgi:hypothetical protein